MVNVLRFKGSDDLSGLVDAPETAAEAAEKADEKGAV
jgi:hypothetical protein